MLVLIDAAIELNQAMVPVHGIVGAVAVEGAAVHHGPLALGPCGGLVGVVAQ